MPDSTPKLNCLVGCLDLYGCIDSTVHVVKNESFLASFLGNKGNRYNPQIGYIGDCAGEGEGTIMFLQRVLLLSVTWKFLVSLHAKE